MSILTYKEEKFYLDGKPYVVLSGTMHYFRIPQEYWYDRLLKLKECGFNTVETYTCWNLHEPKEGVFDFSGMLDIERYVSIAEELGLNVILRPGPYICAEWEFGGLPSWLLTYENLTIRCNDEVYISKVRRYYNELLSRLDGHFASQGGSIFMLQIENEYGSYGNDKEYLQAVLDIYKDNGVDCLFFTSDGACYTMLSGGTLEGHLAVANFGSRAKEQLSVLKEFRPDQPLMCGEFWSGWFDHWFENHHIRPVEEVIECIEDFNKLGASFNMYMFHGGTNFGFTNGANYDDFYAPTITSYDYNAPLSEAGDRTELYYKIREMFRTTYGEVPELTATETPKCAYGKLVLTEKAYLFENLDNISKPINTRAPLFMESHGQDFGYIVYRTTVKGPQNDWRLEADACHDRAQVFVDGKQIAVFERWDKGTYAKADIRLPLGYDESYKLDFLCENMGRVNYGHKLWDRKGMKGIRFHRQYHFGWTTYCLDMKDLSGLVYKSCENAGVIGPVFLKGTLNVKGEPSDTFLRLDGFTKGFVTVNGFNIGRYFNEAGPQKTLYVPAPYLKEGENEIVVFESDCTSSPVVEFFDTPDLG